MLKEVAGTHVYDARRRESDTILRDTHIKAEKIDDLLKYIRTRLEELREEQEQLERFLEVDDDRRCLEYTLYERELAAANNALIRVEESYKRHLEMDASSFRALEGIIPRQRTTEDLLLNLSNDMNDLNAEREQISLQIKNAEDTLARLTVIKDGNFDGTSLDFVDSTKENIAKLKVTITEKQRLLDQLTPKLASEIRAEMALRET